MDSNRFYQCQGVGAFLSVHKVDPARSLADIALHELALQHLGPFGIQQLPAKGRSMVETRGHVILFMRPCTFADLIYFNPHLPEQPPVLMMPVSVANQSIEHHIARKLTQDSVMLVCVGEHLANRRDDVLDCMAGLLITHLGIVAVEIAGHHLVAMHQLLCWAGEVERGRTPASFKLGQFNSSRWNVQQPCNLGSDLLGPVLPGALGTLWRLDQACFLEEPFLPLMPPSGSR
ncbi:hypothetical protein SDC9_164175 [bioreactor metagenome]|uniref:Uncharacterized protein n=1 Tax=bioreactor metagenome TaxID=1076179 RepID=A0A645FQV1_9ZZZZ